MDDSLCRRLLDAVARAWDGKPWLERPYAKLTSCYVEINWSHANRARALLWIEGGELLWTQDGHWQLNKNQKRGIARTAELLGMECRMED